MLQRALAISFLTLVAGFDVSHTVSDPGTCAGACERRIGYSLDPHFTADERTIIEDAMRLWERGTRQRVCFTPGGHDLAIERLASSSELEPWDPDWGNHVGLAQGKRIWIVAPRIEGPGEYRALVVHELGHYLGVPHIEDTSTTFMHSVLTDTPRGLWTDGALPVRDARAFCTVNRCRCAQ